MNHRMNTALSLSGCNPGALRVLAEISATHSITETTHIYGLLEAKKITNEKIWILYKDKCNFSIEEFVKVLYNGNARNLLNCV